MGAVGQKRPSTATLNRLIEQDVKPQVIRQISRQVKQQNYYFDVYGVHLYMQNCNI